MKLQTEPTYGRNFQHQLTEIHHKMSISLNFEDSIDALLQKDAPTITERKVYMLDLVILSQST